LAAYLRRGNIPSVLDFREADATGRRNYLRRHTVY